MFLLVTAKYSTIKKIFPLADSVINHHALNMLLHYLVMYRYHLFSDINVSQGIVARCGGILNKCFTANSVKDQPQNEFKYRLGFDMI